MRERAPRTLLVPLLDTAIKVLLERDGQASEAGAIKLIASTMLSLDEDDRVRLLWELVAITLQGRIDRRVELRDLVRVPDPLERRFARWTPDREREWETWLAQRTCDA